MKYLRSTHQSVSFHLGNHHGVTLIELMVYMVIAGILLATAVVAFTGQNSSYNKQDVISEIQQNMRGSTAVMVSDIRLAGMGLIEEPEKPFDKAEPGELELNYVDDATDDLVTVTYRYDGINNVLLRKEVWEDAGTEIEDTLAENIEQFSFEYLFNNEDNPPPPPEPQEDWQWRISAAEIQDNNALTPTTTKPKNLTEARDLIRGVKIVMLGSARPSAFNPSDNVSYKPPFEAPLLAGTEWVPVSGTGYKQILSTIIQCRNNIE